MSVHFEEQLDYRRQVGGPLLVSWWPLLAHLRESLVDTMAGAAGLGADVVAVELPSADGVFFDAAGALLCRAAAESIGFAAALELIAAGRSEIDAPVLLLSHAQALLDTGLERAAEQAVSSGVDAMAIVDLPADEAGGAVEVLRTAGLSVIHGVTAAADRRRLAQIGAAADGVVWCQDPFDPVDGEVRAALREHKRTARRTGCVVLADPVETPPPKVARRLGGVLLRRLGAGAWEGGLPVGEVIQEALHELRGSAG